MGVLEEKGTEEGTEGGGGVEGYAPRLHSLSGVPVIYMRHGSLFPPGTEQRQMLCVGGGTRHELWRGLRPARGRAERGGRGGWAQVPRTAPVPPL